jgi:hypothetical protein
MLNTEPVQLNEFYVTKDDFPLHDVCVTLSLETEQEPDQGNLNDDCPETSNTARENT